MAALGQAADRTAARLARSIGKGAASERDTNRFVSGTRRAQSRSAHKVGTSVMPHGRSRAPGAATAPRHIPGDHAARKRRGTLRRGSQATHRGGNQPVSSTRRLRVLVQQPAKTTGLTQCRHAWLWQHAKVTHVLLAHVPSVMSCLPCDGRTFVFVRSVR